MRSHKLCVAVGVCVGVGAVGGALAACTAKTTSTAFTGEDGSASGSGSDSGGACAQSLTIAFSPMYSAYIPNSVHTFQIPAVAAGTDGTVTWSASDPSMVGLQADTQLTNGVMITTQKAGMVTINAQSSDNKCGSAVLTITAATDDDWAIGNARYNNGMALVLPTGQTGSGGADAGSYLETDGGGPACTVCHGETAHNFFQDVAHTPEQTGGFDNQALIDIFYAGIVPEGGYFDPEIVAMPIWHSFHQWADISTPDQQRGMVVYLRSLTPTPQMGSVNFAGLTDAAGGG